jgi:hypothetical protein
MPQRKKSKQDLFVQNEDLLSNCTSSAFHVFESPPCQIGIEGVETQLVQPTNALQNDSNIDFEIQASDTYFLHPDIILNLTCTISDEKGADIPATIPATPENNTLDTLFSQVKLYVNNINIDNDAIDNGYKCFLETLLSYNQQVKKGFLSTRGFYTDFAKKKASFLSLKGKKEFGLTGRISHPMLNINKFLCPGMKISLVFKPNKPAFSLRVGSVTGTTAPEGPRINITEAFLMIKRIKPTAVQFNIYTENLLNSKFIKYAINKTQTKYVAIPSNIATLDLQNVTRGPIPRRAIFGLVEHTALAGDYTLDPYKFESFGLSSFNVLLNGRAVKPAYDLAFDNAKNTREPLCTRAYHDLITAVGGVDKSMLDLTYEAFTTDKTLFAFYLGNSLGLEGDSIEPIQNGELTVQLRFKAALQKNICLVCLFEYDRVVTFDNSMNLVHEL